MPNELAYLQRRANFHRRMARRAACAAARCAHQAFVRAYVARIDRIRSAASALRAQPSNILEIAALHPAH